jgi:hypothetical protein
MLLLVDNGREVTRKFVRSKWFPISLTRAIIVIDANGVIKNRKVYFRGFRPTDYSILTSIFEARTEASRDKFEEILKKHREKRKSFGSWLGN